MPGEQEGNQVMIRSGGLGYNDPAGRYPISGHKRAVNWLLMQLLENQN